MREEIGPALIEDRSPPWTVIGQRIRAGAEAAAILGSVIRIATQGSANPIEVLVEIARSDGARSGLTALSGSPP